MTDTRTDSSQSDPAAQADPAVPVGQAIGEAVGQAETVLSRLLAGILAKIGIEREEYLAIQRLTALGGAARQEDYVHDISGAMGIDLWSAGQLTDRLAADGLLTVDGGTARLSSAGAEARDRARDSVREVMAPVWAQTDPADLQTTIRTLRDITRTIRALHPEAVAPAPDTTAQAVTGGNR